ncbi:LCP family protein [Demequina soli]|uniref:LCP family protein n=1 Tax=Demequina soli TaxID=1638987 RepID=UPI000A8F715A|nr:LCP family protein [Demequina soli]
MTDDRDGTPGGDQPRRMPPSIQPRSGQERPGTARPSQPVRRETVRPAPQPAPARPGARQAPPPAQAPQPPQARPASSTRPQAAPPATAPAAPPKRRRRHPVRNVLLALVLILAIAFGSFYVWVNANINHVTALSGAAGTPGFTTLIVGSDSRAGWDDSSTVQGARTDTIMVLHKPEHGPTALISIPRDSYVEIPGHGYNKINAAFSWGGPELLVQTVEGVTNLTIDHYMEVGFSGVAEIVDAVGGVRLCYDHDVDDEKSHLTWKAGCHTVGGKKALAFSRMRYSDPLGDIGRTQRQQQLVSAVAKSVMSPGTILNPFRLVPVVSAGLDAFRVSDETGPIDLARIALAFNSTRGGDAVTGTPPIKDMGYSVAGVGSTVLLDPDQEDAFWAKIANGEFEPGTTVGGVG